MGRTLSYNNTPDQFGNCGSMPDIATANFKFASGQTFNIDNENDIPVTLEVMFANMTTFVSKVFQVGPNPYLLKEVKANAVLTAGQLALLKYGY